MRSFLFVFFFFLHNPFEKEKKGPVMSKISYKNEVIIQGVIVDKVFTNGYVAIRIAADRYMTKGLVMQNYPKIFFIKEKMKLVTPYKVGDNVRVTAYIQSSRKRVDGKNLISQRSFGEEISICKKIINEDDLIEGPRYESPINSVRVVGEVSELKAINENLVLIRAFTERSGKKSGVLFSYRTDSKDFMRKIKAKDHIYMVGKISTIKPETKEQARNIEKVIASEVIKLGRKEED